MNIYISEFASLPAGDMPVLNIRLIKKFMEHGHDVSFIKKNEDNGYHLYTNEALINEYINDLKLFNINKPTKYIYNEFQSYSNEELEDMCEFDYQLNIVRGKPKRKEIFLEAALQHLENLRSAHENSRIDLFIVWGTGFERRIIHHFAKKHNIPIYILELGYFRPFTLTVERKGVNFENSLPRDKEFYERVTVDYGRLDKYLVTPENAYEDLELGLEYREIYEYFIRGHFGKEPNYLVNKPIVYKRKTCDTLEWIKKNEVRYLFVPFQLETDTQMIRFSPNIKSNYQLVKSVIRAVEIYNTLYKDNIHVIFKNHPLWVINNKNMNVTAIKGLVSHYENVHFINDVDTAELIRFSKGIITINSTVGIEALFQYKHVITLGKAFYNIEGIADHCSDPNQLYKHISDCLSKDINSDLITKFIYHLRFNYFFEGFFPNTSVETVEKLYQYMMNNVEELSETVEEGEDGKSNRNNPIKNGINTFTKQAASRY